MNLASSLFPATWHWIMLVLSIFIVSRLVRRAPWRRLLDSSQLNLLLGFAVGLTLLWSLRAGVKPGLSLHMLGAMAATLTLGPWLGLLALGADGVLICRPFVTAVYGGGAEGVKCYIDKLAGELTDTMQMCGAHTLAEITPDMVRV